MIIPLIEIRIDKTSPLQEPMVIIENVLSTSGWTLEASLNNEKIDKVETLSETAILYSDYSISLTDILFIIYIAGGLINLVGLLISVKRMVKLIKKGQKIDCGDYQLVLTDKNINPFTWKNYIMLSRIDYEMNREEIISHERAHISYRHFIDLIFTELILIIQWFNPAAWLMKRELKTIHEYQADKYVLQSGIDATRYQLLLVKKAVGASSYTLASSFNHIKIKKRITMMLKKRSTKWARFKLLFLLPLGLLTIYSFAQPHIGENKLTELPTSSIVKDEPKFCFPLPTAQNVASNYGLKGNTKKMHNGCDLRGLGKDTIYAVFEGEVIKSAFERRSYGNYVILKHENELQTLYGHNSVNLVKEGDRVKAGQPIAITGNTGRSTGEHLHFEIRKDGKAIDPETIINFEKKALR